MPNYGNNDGRIKLDYDLEPLIEEFNHDGIYALFNSPNSKTDRNGAYLAITGKQYVLAFNYDYGLGEHVISAAKIFSEISGKKLVRENFYSMRNKLEKESSIITALLRYEYFNDNENSISVLKGSIDFYLGDKKFNSSEIEMFLQFYDDYGYQIRRVCHNYNFSVVLSYSDEKEKFGLDISKDLENVKKYILSHRNDNVKDYFEENNITERIIGIKKKNGALNR